MICYLCVVIISYLLINPIISSNSNKQRVAFIFAGSARSFIMPAVYLSIKHNLIESFCPKRHCIYDIYIRITSSDNNHLGLNSSGVFTQSDDKKKQQVFNILDYYKSKLSPYCHLYYDYYELGSNEDFALMNSYSNDIRHRIYRELDSRRYSMFYCRYMAYKMMLTNELKFNITYDWVVHARLDAGWAEPIKPCNKWTNNNVIYVPDTWMVDIPDTFAILPRRTSDIFYSLDYLMLPGILCLGGPNLDLKTLRTKSLQLKGYNDTEIQLIQREDCLTLFPGDYKMNDANTNSIWSSAGISEIILRRKFHSFGYEIGLDNIQLVSLSMFLVRYPYNPICFFLKTSYLISWVKVKQAANTALLSSCFIMTYDMFRYNHINSSICQINSSYIEPLDNDTIKESVGLKQSCLFSKDTSNFNFMPFRIRHLSYCLTMSPINKQIIFEQCVNYNRQKFMEQYIMTQLFNFHPLIKSTQRISISNTDQPFELFCLTSIRDNKSYYQHKTYSLSMHICNNFDERNYYSAQRFFISHNQPSNPIKHTRNNTIANVFSGIIQWIDPNDIRTKYCLYSKPSDYNQSIIIVILQPCNSNQYSSAEYVRIERTTSSGPPYRPGITIGSYPTWADKE